LSDPAPTAYVFLFSLPSVLRLGVRAGRISPCLHQVQAAIDPNFKVRIVGPSETQVTDQAARFLAEHAKGHGTLPLILATMIPPGRPAETWNIAVGADVVYSPGIAPPKTWPPAEARSTKKAEVA
jgi:hypothetical protein